ncbi:MAG: hypothetical protein V4719_21920 [Planctomycetota bacterium]
MSKVSRSFLLHVILASFGFAAFNVISREFVLWLPGLTVPSDLPEEFIPRFQRCQNFQWDPQHIPLVKGLEVVHSPVLKQELPQWCFVERRVGFRPQWFIPRTQSISAHPTFIERWAIGKFDHNPIRLSAIDKDVHVKVLELLVGTQFSIRDDDAPQVLQHVVKEVLPEGALSRITNVGVVHNQRGRFLRTSWTRRYRPGISYLVKINQNGTLKGASVDIEFPRQPQ